MEYRYLHDVVSGWTEGEGRRSNKFRILLIKKKKSDEVVEVHWPMCAPSAWNEVQGYFGAR